MAAEMGIGMAMRQIAMAMGLAAIWPFGHLASSPVGQLVTSSKFACNRNGSSLPSHSGPAAHFTGKHTQWKWGIELRMPICSKQNTTVTQSEQQEQ